MDGLASTRSAVFTTGLLFYCDLCAEVLQRPIARPSAYLLIMLSYCQTSYDTVSKLPGYTTSGKHLEKKSGDKYAHQRHAQRKDGSRMATNVGNTLASSHSEVLPQQRTNSTCEQLPHRHCPARHAYAQLTPPELGRPLHACQTQRFVFRTCLRSKSPSCARPTRVSAQLSLTHAASRPAPLPFR